MIKVTSSSVASLDSDIPIPSIIRDIYCAGLLVQCPMLMYVCWVLQELYVLARCSSWNWKIVINLLNANAIVSQKNSKTFNQRHFRSIWNSINCSWEMELWQGFVYWSWNKRLFWCKPLCLSDVGWLFKCEKWWSFIVFLSMKQRVVNVSGIIINYTSH